MGVLESISTEEAYYEAISLEAGINKDVMVMNQAVVSAEQLGNSIANKEHMFVSAEAVNDDCVELAKESLDTTALLLGASCVSVESSNTMELAIEADKSFLGKIIDSIKSIFKKIVNSAKKLYGKLLVAMNGSAKQAKELKNYIAKNLKDTDRTSDVFKESEGKYLSKHTFISDTIVKNKLTVNGGRSIDTITAIMKLEEECELRVAAIYEAGGDNVETEVTAEYMKLADDINSTVSRLGILSTDIAEEYFGYNKPDAKNDYVEIFITSHNTNKVRVVESYVVSEDKGDVKHINIRTLVGDMSKVNDSKVKVMDIKSINDMLDKVIVRAKDLPKVEKASSKAIAQADKMLDKLAKANSKGSTLSYAVNKLKADNLTRLRDMTVTTLVNSVIDEVKLVKADIYTAKRHITMYNKSAM